MLLNVSKFKKLKLKHYKLHEKLSGYTTFKIGGAALAFVKVQNIKELKKILRFCLKNKLKYFILGGGSNVVFSDNGFDGVVIKFSESFQKLKIKKKKNYSCLKINAGEKLNKVNLLCKNLGLSGLEFSFGIPATFGGAVCSNVGSFNEEISTVIKKVYALKQVKFLGFNFLKTVKLSNKKCKFSYRNSVFKSKKYIILSAKICLLQKTVQEVYCKMNYCLSKKKQTQPLNTKNAGCVFKNGENYKIAELIEKLNLKGKSVGGAQISTKHSNFIVNSSNATCQNVKDLVKYTQSKVFKAYGVKPELEIEFI